MRSHARLTLTFRDAETAKAIEASVALEDEGYIRTRRAGRTITAVASAASPMSLLHTLNDYLACVSVAERAIEAAHPRGRARRRRA